MEKLVPENLTFCEVGHLPIIKDFAKKIRLVDGEMELSPGIAVLAMVLDTLSGRTPLYRLEEFFQEKDTELILGHDVMELFCDYNVGRLLERNAAAPSAMLFVPTTGWIWATSIRRRPQKKRPAAYYRGFETTVEKYANRSAMNIFSMSKSMLARMPSRPCVLRPVALFYYPTCPADRSASNGLPRPF